LKKAGILAKITRKWQKYIIALSFLLPLQWKTPDVLVFSSQKISCEIAHLHKGKYYLLIGQNKKRGNTMITTRTGPSTEPLIFQINLLSYQFTDSC
jgi:hypothetical protein